MGKDKKDNTKLDFTGQHIYVGIDTGKKGWKVTILTEEFEHNTFTQPPEPDVLVGHLRRNFPGATYHCVYEAGYFGFWIHDALKQKGVDCMVVHPADVPTKSDVIVMTLLMPVSWHATCVMTN